MSWHSAWCLWVSVQHSASLYCLCHGLCHGLCGQSGHAVSFLSCIFNSDKTEAQAQAPVTLPMFTACCQSRYTERNMALCLSINNNQKKPTDTTRPACKRYFKPMQTKTANTSKSRNINCSRKKEPHARWYGR